MVKDLGTNRVATTPPVVFDFTNNALSLRQHFGPELELRCLLDAQLAYEVVRGGVRRYRVGLKGFPGKRYTVQRRRAK